MESRRLVLDANSTVPAFVQAVMPGFTSTVTRAHKTSVYAHTDLLEWVYYVLETWLLLVQAVMMDMHKLLVRYRTI
jgi:hypothetical protein